MGTIDVNSIVSQLMAIERQPLQKFDVKNIGIKQRISAYGTIQSGLASFQAAAKGLNNADSFNTISASSSSSDDIGISAAKNATVGKFSVEVSQLAKNQKLASATYASMTSSVGTGTITLDFGTYTSSGAVTSFTSNPDKTSKTITIDASNNTLTGMRDAINKAGAGVTASIVNDGTGYKLALVSTDTGAANSLRIKTTDSDGNNTDASGLSAFAYNATTDGTLANPPIINMAQSQSAQNALFKIDGISISKASNVVSDAVDGVTLTLNKVTTSPVNMNVAKDTSGIGKAVQSFVKAYNDLSKTLKDLSAYNPDTKNSGLLNGDGTIRSLQLTMRSALSQTISGTGSEFDAIAKVGIKIDKDGVMSVDTAKLNAAITKDPQGVIGLFASSARSDDSLIRIDSFTSQTETMDGKALSVISNATQATYTGSVITFPPTGFVVDSSNKSFNISIDGTSASVTLSEGSYTSAQLAAELQTQINSNSSLSAGGLKVGVKIGADNKIVVSNSKYGSANSIEVTSSLLGSPASGQIKGTDVQVKVAGEIKTGVGQQVTLDNGLKFSVLGGTASSPDGADRGELNFSRGLGFQLDSQLTKILAKGGLVSAKVDGMNEQAKSIATRTEEFNRRLVDVEKRYRTQYTALDLAVTKMQSTSDWLSTQLANLPKAS